MDALRRLGVVGGLALATFGYLIVLAIYRLTFHPLAKYPGPFLRKISGWPDAISAVRGRRFLDHYHLHCKYGDVVRFAPNALAFSTVQAVNDIYVNRNANAVKTGWTEASTYINASSNTHTVMDKKQHALKRRLLAHAFSETALKAAEEYALSRIRAFCEYVGPSKEGSKDGWSEAKDMGHWMALLTLDILGELCFGESFGAMEAGDHDVVRLLLGTGRLLQSIAFLPGKILVWLVLRNKTLLETINKKAAEQRWAYRMKVSELTKKRSELEEKTEKEGTATRKDFFHYLFRAVDPETGVKFPRESFVGEAAILVGAGTDTSATAMAACLFYLVRNPSTLQALSKEVGEAFSEVEEIRTGTKLTSLRYLRGCIDEAMRLSPPVAGLLDRRILPGGAIIDGHALPAGVVVGVSIYALHHNEKYHTDSFSFLPERWVPGMKTPLFDVTEESVKLERSAFTPFSSGIRNCIGKNLAYMEMLVTIARLVWLYDIRFAKSGPTGGGGPEMLEFGRQQSNIFQLVDWLIADKHGPTLEFKERKLG